MPAGQDGVAHGDRFQNGTGLVGDLDLAVVDHPSTAQIVDRKIHRAGARFMPRGGDVGQFAAFPVGNQPVLIADVEVIARRMFLSLYKTYVSYSRFTAFPSRTAACLHATIFF